ncbi:MotA/TolQ/ExbB proton channel family protein [Halarcobacter ebronensis]|uniref:MotA/TolQ/ExbB proton channel family protein n=1 Tax=Halarcobacter ebronensis TaxID=1462615 RepID=UPI003C7639E1
MIKYILATLLIINSSFALDLENLLHSVKQTSNKEIIDEKKRLKEFVENKNQQKALLLQAKKDLKLENIETKRLKKLIEANEEVLTSKEAELNVKIGDLGEMFGSVRQTSADFLTNYQRSFTASEFPQKEEIFTKFSNSKKLPTIDELTSFWHTMLDEIIQSGQVSTYQASVILQNGERNIQDVTRVGVFSAFSNGNFLKYSNDINSLIELSTQPSSAYTSNAKDFEASSNEIKSALVDPTRGTLFEMLGNNPTIIDRINQGGIVGYIIITLGVLGLLFAAYKIVFLNLIHTKIKKQQKNLEDYDESNSLGKIAGVFYKNVNDSINDLEIKIGEAILKETNHIKKGQSFVKLLAAVTPLLGLLGTVTGMIATFQAITLFGTGDPKLMAGGISTALITTVLGLVTAIPLLFAYTYISSKAEAIVSVLEEQSIGMLAKTLK